VVADKILRNSGQRGRTPWHLGVLRRSREEKMIMGVSLGRVAPRLGIHGIVLGSMWEKRVLQTGVLRSIVVLGTTGIKLKNITQGLEPKT